MRGDTRIAAIAIVVIEANPVRGSLKYSRESKPFRKIIARNTARTTE
jgi:hypothetical protein